MLVAGALELPGWSSSAGLRPGGAGAWGAADVAWGVAPAAGLALGLVAANALAFIVPAGGLAA